MYNDFFGFSDSPFENNLDQRFLFLSQDHNEVLAALFYFIQEEKPFALLCGDVGTGKTMLINSFLARLQKSAIPIIISNPTVQYQEILLWVASKLGINNTNKSILDLVDDVKEALIKEKIRGRKYILIIDEAHLLSDQSLEHIRLLSNIETPQQKLLQILLVGQYELSHKLSTPEMRQLRQRISINRFLSNLDKDESIQYIDHRLRVVGSNFLSCFKPGCRNLIYRITGGVPRLINQVCDNALLICKTEGPAKVNKKIIKKADEALRSDLIFTPKSFSLMKPLTITSICLVLLVVLGVLSFRAYFGNKHAPMRPEQFTSNERPLHSMVPESEDTENTPIPPVLPVLQEPLLSTIEKHPEIEFYEHVSSAPVNTDEGLTEKHKLSSQHQPSKKELQTPSGENESASLFEKIVIKEGDTLMKIASRHYDQNLDAGVDAILQANPAIKNIDIIYPDQEIIIPKIKTNVIRLIKSATNKETYYMVQVSTLSKSSKTTKDNIAQQLREKGYPAHVTKVQDQNGKHIYDIYIGRYKTETEADEMALSIWNKEKSSSIIVLRQFPPKNSDSDFYGFNTEFNLHKDLHHAFYGYYNTLEKFQHAMNYLIHKKIKFIVENSTGSDGTTTYRIILGGYKKKEDLTRAVEMLKNQKGES